MSIIFDIYRRFCIRGVEFAFFRAKMSFDFYDFLFVLNL